MADIAAIKTQVNTVIREKTEDNSITPDNVADMMDATLDAVQDVMDDLDTAEAAIVTINSNVANLGSDVEAIQEEIDTLGGTEEKGVYDFMEIDNDGNYNGFPVVVKRGTDLYAFYMKLPLHVATSNNFGYKKSTDGGRSWGSHVTVTTNEHEQFAVGVTSSGRMVLLTVVNSDTYTAYRTGVNNDTWTDLGEIENPISGADGQIFGKIKECPGGGLMMANYYRTDSGQEKSGFVASDDDGLTWSYFGDMATGTNEFGFEFVSGTSREDMVIMVVARLLNNNAKNRLYISNAGASSFTNTAEVPLTRIPTYGFPFDIYNDGTNIWVVTGGRFSGVFYAAPLCICYWSFPVAEYDTVGNWGPERTMYNSISSLKGNYNDWGYPSIYAWNGEIYSLFYECSPTQPQVSPQTLDARVISVRISNRYEAYFRRTSGGTFPTANLPYSKFLMPAVLDSAGFSQQLPPRTGAANEFCIIIPKDGTYRVRQRVKFANTNLNGDYRLFGCQLVDKGYPTDVNTEYPENAVTGAEAPEAIREIISELRAPVDTVPALTFTQTATFFAEKGKELVIFGGHNAGAVQINVEEIRVEIALIHY